MKLRYIYFVWMVCLMNSIHCKKLFHHDHRKHRSHLKHKYYYGHDNFVPLSSSNDVLMETFINNKDNNNMAALTEMHQLHIRHHHEEIPWPVKKEAVVEGDLILGGLMMVHEREDSVTCGPIMPQGGIQALEAMLYTLDRLNFAKEPLLPNITLGAHILDDCDKDTYGLEMAVDFIKGMKFEQN